MKISELVGYCLTQKLTETGSMIWCHVPQQWLKIASKLEYHIQTKQTFWEQMTHILFLLCLKRTGILYHQYNRVGSGIPQTDRIKWRGRFQSFFSQPRAMDVKLHSLSLTQFTIRICCFKTHTKFVGVHTPMVFLVRVSANLPAYMLWMSPNPFFFLNVALPPQRP